MLEISADFLLGVSDNFSLKMGGLTEEQEQPFFTASINCRTI
ncbi:hypothetical protein RU92_GL002112 [Lactococcus cremoris subsp. tructae]|uniref:Uncharacterized protein n=1 Tax=Lactococcus cremoris subsp. tructae TaxID=542833 RepID=A0A2A5SSZ4_LACLC|nr:hypothetical protein RU92_GL002112 [Lactococcus cremoris subsp. tructae]